MLITDPNKPDNPIVFSNDAFSRLTGYAREEILGRNCRFLQGPRTNPEAVSKIRDAIERHIPIEIELQNHKKDGEVFWNRVLISPVFDESGGEERRHRAPICRPVAHTRRSTLTAHRSGPAPCGEPDVDSVARAARFVHTAGDKRGLRRG